ncbi:MAG: AI-2E family transporter [Anaerolineae bacterium]|nr:AI-2E family transporter [Anaerolineae bacterium]
MKQKPETPAPEQAHPLPPTAAPTSVVEAAVPQWDRTTRLLVVIGLIIAGVYALTLISAVMQTLIFAFLITFLIYGPARAITRHLHLPWTLSVVLLYVLVLAATIGILLIVIPTLISGSNALIAEGVTAYDNLRETLRNYEPDMGIITVFGFRIDFNSIAIPIRQFVLGDELAAEQADAEETGVPADVLLEPLNFQQLIDGFTNIAGRVSGTVTSAITSVTGFIGALFLALFVSFLILLDWPNTSMSVVNWVSPAYQREFRLLVAELTRVWNGFFRGQVIIGVVIGIVTWLQLVLMGIEGAEVLAVFTAFISLIPTLGGFISLIPLGLVPLLRGSTVFVTMPYWAVALLVIGGNLIISQVVWNVLAPMILGDALDLPLPVIIVGVFIGTAVGGVLGAFLVAPTMGTIRVIVEYVFHKVRQEDPYPGLP